MKAIRRNIHVLVAGCSALFMTVAAVPGPVQSETTILKYDSQGRVIGAKRQQGATGGPEKLGRTQRHLNRAGAEPQAVAHQILVMNPPLAFRDAAAALRLRLEERVFLANLEVEILRYGFRPGRNAAEVLGDLRRRLPGVMAAENSLYRLAGRTSASFARAAVGWGPLERSCASKLRIGMLDAWINPTHPVLRGQALRYHNVHSAAPSTEATDHGTAVAALFIGRPTGAGLGGLVPEATLFAANIFTSSVETGIGASALGFLRALDWVLQQKVHTINLSVAGSDNRILRRIFRRLQSRNIVLVGAAGNNGQAQQPSYPAAYENVIAVTAVDGSFKRYPHANQGRYVEFSAPGVDILTAVSTGARLQSGTSFAAPFVTAFIAMQAAAGKSPNLSAVRRRLREIATDLGPPGHDPLFGWGIIQTQPECVAAANK